MQVPNHLYILLFSTQSTVRKTFSDFRRTHTDTWHEDMLQFDEDQLSLLTDMLISPSYYA